MYSYRNIPLKIFILKLFNPKTTNNFDSKQQKLINYQTTILIFIYFVF